MSAPSTTASSIVDESYYAVSPSELSNMDCDRKHHLIYTEGLRARKKTVALRTGSAFDVFTNEWFGRAVTITDADERFSRAAGAAGRVFDADAEVYAELVKHDDVVAAKLIAKWCTPDPDDGVTPEDQLAEAIDLAVQDERTTLLAMMFHYVAHWGVEDIDLHGVQVPLDSVKLRTETGAKSRYVTKPGMAIDVLYRDADGRLVMRDVKTTATIDEGFRLQWSKSRQMLWYGVIMRELGKSPDVIEIDAAARRRPMWPELLANGVEVLDAAGDPVMEPIPCADCAGLGGTVVDAGDFGERMDACSNCDGKGHEIYKRAGKTAAKGDPKLRKKRKPALQTLVTRNDAGYVTGAKATTLEVLLAAIDVYGLDDSDYASEIAYYASDAGRQRWFWRRQYVVSDAALDRAQAGWLRLSKRRRDLTDEPMPSPTKCQMCAFADNGVCEAASLEAVADVIAVQFERRVPAPDALDDEDDGGFAAFLAS